MKCCIMQHFISVFTVCQSTHLGVTLSSLWSVLIFSQYSEKTCLSGFENNKSADQPVHPCRLISTFVICFLESIISRLAMSEISIFCNWAGRFESHFGGNHEHRFFLALMPILLSIYISYMFIVFAEPCNAIGSNSNCRFGGLWVWSQSAPYFPVDWSWNNFYGHSPPLADSRKNVIG